MIDHLRDQEARLRQWYGASLANRIGLGVLATALLFAVAVGAANFLYVAHLTQEREAEHARDALEQAAQRLAFTFNAVVDDVRLLARNPQVISGVLDSNGQDVYLRPLFRSARPEGRAALSLCLSNYRGESVGCDSQPRPDYSREPWLGEVLKTGSARAVIAGRQGRPVLILAHPVVYEATGEAEGAVVAEYDLARLTDQATNFLPAAFHRHLAAASQPELVMFGEHIAHGFISQPLRLAPVLAPLGLELGLSRAELLLPLGNLILIYLLLGGLLVPVAWKVSSAVAGALTERMAAMTRQAEKVAETGLLNYPLIQEGEDEVARLSRAFSAMTERVREINAGLERRVEERTRELEAQRQLLRTLLQTLPDLVWLKDVNGAYLFCNARFEKLYGVAEAELLGKTDYDLVDKDLADSFRANDRLVLEAGASRTNEEWVTFSADGHRGLFETVKTPMRDAGGQVVGVLGIARDITDRKQAEAQLVQYSQRLERSNKDLQDFAYIASHDLQEPLRKITAFGERLASKAGDRLDEQERDYLMRMMKASARMQDLIDSLLAYSRVSTRAQPPEPISLNQVLEDVLDNLEQRIAASGAAIHVAALPEIEAEPTQMRQLFQNLIGNAIKFADPARKPEIRVDAEAVNGNLVRIKVTDNGIGFDPQYAERIFGVFERLHGRHEYEGTGVGLAICRKIVERHGGTIVAEGRPGEGATFTVVLPLKAPGAVSGER